MQDVAFIGIEPFVNSMAKLVQSVSNDPIDNLRLFDDDATFVLDWLPDHCLDHIDLLYPDPWTKKRHWKRRFVSKVNLDRFARVLKPGGKFCFASDIDTYVNWTLQHIKAHDEFSWIANGPDDWTKPWQDWPSTRYEAKAFREGRTPAYLDFIKK
jgi:tRNA (guanine-N7-)-methyltransferase